MSKLLLVANYPKMAMETIGNIRILKKKMKKLQNDLDYMSGYVFRLRNKINTQMQQF